MSLLDRRYEALLTYNSMIAGPVRHGGDQSRVGIRVMVRRSDCRCLCVILINHVISSNLNNYYIILSFAYLFVFRTIQPSRYIGADIKVGRAEKESGALSDRAEQLSVGDLRV